MKYKQMDAYIINDDYVECFREISALEGLRYWFYAESKITTEIRFQTF